MTLCTVGNDLQSLQVYVEEQFSEIVPEFVMQFGVGFCLFLVSFFFFLQIGELLPVFTSEKLFFSKMAHHSVAN